MSEFYNQSRANSRRSDYVWQYEYYDDEEPVSFEGLKAHRYSIVIGFWVGLAVFVIFMFFVLMLLTKTGAPHQENPEPAEKRHRRLGDCVVDINSAQDEIGKAFCRPPLALSHFYVSEEEQAQGQCECGTQAPKGHRRLQGIGSYGREDMLEEGEEAEAELNKERVFSPQFNIPNFVTSDHSSTLEDDDLLLCEPAVTLANNSQSHAQDF